MSDSLAQIAGIDIAKDHLDVHLHPSGATRRVSNDKAGSKALLHWFARQPVERIVFEATGPYHRRLERALGAAGLPFAKINPRQARRFAEATGRLAKTGSMPPCSPVWARCCSPNPGSPRARGSMS